MFTKRADAADFNRTADIMRRVLAEDPSYWPYGLDASQFDGGLYMISKSASHEPVGFVGWQVRQEQGRDIGYYAIGVLPEFRQQGFAKEAVTSLLREKSASVDEVRALVCSHNQPSKNLARSLGVTLIEKVASIEKAAMAPHVGGSPKAQVVGSILGALGSTAFFDQTANPDREIGDTLQPWNWDKRRMLMGGMNAALGALGGQQIADGHTIKGLTALVMAPGKDLMLKGIDSLHKIDNAAVASKNALTTPRDPGGDAKAVLAAIPKPLLLGALGLGVGGLGVAAYSTKKKMDMLDAQATASRAGRVKVTLPTKKPGDSETMLDLPMEDIQLSNALRMRLGRDTRRRLYTETRERTARRKPKDPAAPSEKELEDQQLQAEEELLSKESSIANLLAEIRPQWRIKEAAAAPPTTPTPPPQGVNPALRMTQQQATANSIQPSTEANPQIMKAQQDAAQAEMTAQQSTAQAEQAAAQQAAQLQQEAATAQMEQQQKFSEQLSKAKQENEVLKMQIEKAKVEGDLAKAKSKAETELSKHQAGLSGANAKGEQNAVQRLTQSRLDRLQKNISKKANASLDKYEQSQREEASKFGPPAHAKPTYGNLDAQTGKIDPGPTSLLKPNSAQLVNDNGYSLTGSGAVAPVGMYRTSYGKIGDWLYDNLYRASSLQPSSPVPTGGLSYAAMINNPDKMSMLENASRMVNSGMRMPQM
jgi:hypothetical protein